MHRLIALLLSLALILPVSGPGRLFANDMMAGRDEPDTPDTTNQTPAPGGDLKKQFDEATAYFTHIRTDRERAATPANWDTALNAFQRIHDANPASSYAAASLFMIGRISYARYQQSKNPTDLDLALDHYARVVTLYPWHPLADDCLLTMGRIQLDDKKNPREAARLYGRIVSEYHTGDLLETAMERLRFLAQGFNTPIPAVPKPPAEATATSPAPATPTPDELPNVKNRSYVRPVEHWSSDNYTRVVIKTSRPVEYREELLEKVGEQPRRLLIDLDKSYIEPRYRAPIPIRDGLLQQVRTAQFTPDTVRVVLDIESIDSYRIYSLPDPFRVIVDVHGQPATARTDPPQPPSTELAESEIALSTPKPTVGETAGEGPPLILQDAKKVRFSSTPKGPAPERNAPILSLAQQLNLGVRRIVIDPGHGGKDPGATAFGLKEKDIVLQIAKKLAIHLRQELGCEVLLTRDRDVFLSLEERTAIANTSNADLFISLHLNAHPSEKVHGIETYYLNLSTDPEAIRVAALENATSTRQLSDLQDILSEILQNCRLDESSRLARHVQETLSTGLASRNSPQARDLGVKQAPFYVLIGAKMPAILIEMAFITNQTDAAQIKKERYQEQLATDITRGLQKYIRTITAGL